MERFFESILALRFSAARSSVIVPPGATGLNVRLESMVAGIEADLFVRYMEDVVVDAGGYAITDHMAATDGGSENLTITAASDPPLRPGRYYVAFGKFTTGVAAEIRLTATVLTGNNATATEAPRRPAERLLQTRRATAVK